MATLIITFIYVKFTSNQNQCNFTSIGFNHTSFIYWRVFAAQQGDFGSSGVMNICEY